MREKKKGHFVAIFKKGDWMETSQNGAAPSNIKSWGWIVLVSISLGNIPIACMRIC